MGVGSGGGQWGAMRSNGGAGDNGGGDSVPSLSPGRPPSRSDDSSRPPPPNSSPFWGEFLQFWVLLCRFLIKNRGEKE